jgi:replicative DNA helicase
VAYDLRRIANQGCAVIFTALSRHADLVAPATTLAGELCAVPGGTSRGDEDRAMEFRVYKNRIGETGTVSLNFVPGAGLFEEPSRRS